MKRAIAIILLLLSVLTQATPVRAENTMFTTTDLNDWASTAVIIGTKFGFDIAGLIIPSFEKTRQNAYVDYEPFAVYMKQYQDWNMPGAYVQSGKIKDKREPITRTSLYGAITKVDGEPYGTSNTSPECYISKGLQESSPVEFLPELLASLELIDAPVGLQAKQVNPEGFIDVQWFNDEIKPKMVLQGMNAAEDCKKMMVNTPWKPYANDQVSLSSFAGGSTVQGFMQQTVMVVVERVVRLANGLFETVTEEEPLMHPVHERVILTEKRRAPYQEELCHAGSAPCPGNQVGNYTPGLAEHAGWPGRLMASRLQKAQEPHAGVNDEITVVGFPAGKKNNSELVANHMKVGLCEASCMVTAAGKSQNIAVMGTPEKFEPINWCCRKDGPMESDYVEPIPPNVAITSPIDPDDGIGEQCTPQGGTGQSSGNIVQAVQAGAAKAGIPLCVLDGVAKIEGAYAGGACTPNQCGAMGPFQLTVGYTYAENNGQCVKDSSCSQCGGVSSCPNAIADYLQGVAQTLGHQVDPCNANDAAYAAASMLKGKAAYFNTNLSGSNSNVSIANEALLTAIIYAGNSYYGSSEPFTSGSNIVPGCSYGESIVKNYCGVSAYTCGTLNRPVNQGPPQDEI